MGLEVKGNLVGVPFLTIQMEVLLAFADAMLLLCSAIWLNSLATMSLLHCQTPRSGIMDAYRYQALTIAGYEKSPMFR